MSEHTSSAIIHNNTGDHLYMWGDNQYDQQGHSTVTSYVATPTKINPGQYG